jgi:probable phosphoglycerate mutase
MMYVLRQGRTTYSAEHRCNGDLAVRVELDGLGAVQAEAAQSWPCLPSIRTCVTSRFRRSIQPADLLLRPSPAPVIRRVVVPELDEIGYGDFEGCPWSTYGTWLHAYGRYAVPPGATESLDQAVGRLLTGLRICLEFPGPRLIIGHGLML